MEGEVIIVAVDASKEVSQYALEWAASNVARASDSLILLALVPSRPINPNIRAHQSRTSRIFSCNRLRRLLKKLGIDRRNEGGSRDDIVLVNGVDRDIFNRANNVYLNIMQELCSAHGHLTQVQTEVKVVDLQLGSVASKAEELQASWVILDRHLKGESEYCLKQLNCNVVLVDHTTPKLLKAVNLSSDKNLKRQEIQNNETETGLLGLCPRNVPRGYILSTATTRSSADVPFSLSSPLINNIIPREKLNNLNPCYFNEKVESHFQSKLQLCNKPSNFVTGKSHPKFLANPLYEKSSYEESSKTSLPKARRAATALHSRPNHISSHSSKNLISKTDLITINESEAPVEISSPMMNRTSSVRKAVSLYVKQPPNPPPLCSICKHNAPIFGKAPRKFSFTEIERATNGFSAENFLAEGGFGPVYKGVLSDGQVVAVKQHKTLSAQGASEFCSEVEVLSCAQHRNLVMLVGYCVETAWLLVYEFSCNGSLDKHLYGTEKEDSMSWKNRIKVAIGAARGLRYLHEDCRVGCIIHRDFRPNNILLTHDFEPMVGDFGLARWQVDGQSAEETRVIGALGYLAPEYTLSGLVTEKTDVYAFGVVLLELLSGFNVTEFSRKTGQQFISEWGSPLLERMNLSKIIDPLLDNNYVKKEVECMMVAARLCISPNPDQRPRMSKVLKILEGDVLTNISRDYRKRSSVCSSRNTSFSRQSNLIESEKPSACGENKETTTSIPVSLSKQNKTPSGENKGEEYQAYLRVSLAQFFQELN